MNAIVLSEKKPAQNFDIETRSNLYSVRCCNTQADFME